MISSLARSVAIGTAATLYIGLRHVQLRTITLGELLLVMTYLAQLYRPLETITKRVTRLAALASADRVFALLDEAPHVTERADARRLADVCRELSPSGHVPSPTPLNTLSCTVFLLISARELVWASVARRVRVRLLS